ncbi:MAG: sigma-54-dependent Fis family transcriptional regulator [Proteobacteria bacterium]|nr:sigma-54-dependent Fis family transcriptional regulator [Pseudomonadota bacterium]
MKTNLETKPSVLIVDDDISVGKVLSALLEQAGFETTRATNGTQALQVLQSRIIDLVFTDLRMPEIDGMELLRRMRQRWPDIGVVMLTAHGSIPGAVAAMKEGATDFLLKPFDREEVVYIAKRTLEATAQVRKKPPKPANLSGGLIAESSAMQQVEQILKKAATSRVTVLIRGESGTGKELIARMVHQQSDRREGPFVVVDCGSIPENLVESELFGYEKGAFTGAAKRKPGRVELAEGGTIFLDEIGDLPMALQVKLLRLLQEREYQPLGATSNHHVDVRFVAATHRDLDALVASGDFRADLYYRLSVVQIWLPPLRERPEDIGPLIQKAVKTFAQNNDRTGLTISAEAVAQLIEQPWPGNVRELQNVVEALVVLAERDEITLSDVESEFVRHRRSSPAQPSNIPSSDVKLETRLSNAEREAIAQALERASGNRSLAARLLGISRRTLYNKMAEYDLP